MKTCRDTESDGVKAEKSASQWHESASAERAEEEGTRIFFYRAQNRACEN